MSQDEWSLHPDEAGNAILPVTPHHTPEDINLKNTALRM